ncbi:hypothetical protein LV716_05745 [Flagellimonas sp. HMM57]|uniref:hypothetical protein n=1 Tax=unclassified Flagellimonas TaxID=2644544 RepID=UPI0013D0F8E7|nr:MULTISPECIES: hypothetical protein [unclassified Flagellimonas]UII77274.1 hypothetical protein LV716_05745 [Flagellimonas sp. HMM57]
MKKTTTHFLLLISFQLLYSQSTYFDITESEAFPDTNKISSIETAYIASSGEIATASTGKNKLAFDVYDSNANSVFNAVIVLNKKEEIVGRLEHNDLLKIFTVFAPKKTEREIRCYVFDIQKRSYQFVELFKTTVEKKQVLFSGQNKRQTNFATSPNGTFFAVATDNIKKNSNSYNIHVYSSKTMELVYQQTFFENPEKFFKSFDMVIDDLGTVFSIGKEYEEGRDERRVDEIPNYSIVINKTSESETFSNRIQLNESQHIADLKIIQKENQLHLYGFYSTKVAGRISGLSKFIVEKDEINIIETEQTKLPESVLADIYSSKRIESKKDKELNNYYLDYVIEDERGNITLLAEQFYTTQVYINNGQYGGYWMTTFHYNNILILSIDNHGKLKWGRSIFKVSDAPSYNAFVLDKRLHILFNAGKNLKEKEDGRIKAKKGWLQSTALFDYSYNENGEVTQEKLRENKGRDIYHPYSGSFQNNRFIMLNASNFNKKVMLLEAKE